MLIALCGLAGSGKDTIANSLGNDWKLVSFASPLRSIVSSLALFNEQDKKEPGEFGVCYRRSMMVLGTKIREELKQWLPELCIDSDNIFVEIAAKKIHKYIKLGYNVCVTDLRFENELRMIKEQKGIVIHIIREDVEKINIPSESMDYAKVSDFAIYNNSSVREASERLLDIVTQNK